MVRSVNSSPGSLFSATIPLSLNHLRNLEKYPVGVGGIFHGDVLRKRFPQTVSYIFADGIGESVARRCRLVLVLILIVAIAVGDLSHGRNFVGFQFAESLDVF